MGAYVQNAIGTDELDAFANELTSKNVSYEAKGYRAVDSRYIDKQARQAVIRRLSEEGSSTGQNREFLRALVSNAVAKDAEFRGITEDECLNLHWFVSFKDAQQKINEWNHEYNNVRPHSALANLSPEEFISSHQIAPEIPALG